MIKNNIDDLIEGSSLVGNSSRDLGWNNLNLERRTRPPYERAEGTIDDHYFLLWGDAPSYVKRKSKSGASNQLIIPPSSLIIGEAGLLKPAISYSTYDVVAGTISPSTITELMYEEYGINTFSIYEHLGIQDQALASLIGLAASEADQRSINGKLYIDSIIQAIIIRFAILSSTRDTPYYKIHQLPRPQLYKVLEYINDNYYKNISLNTLASIARYSKTHFLRSFKATTGKTPHQYLIDIRLTRAYEQISKSNKSISNIALDNGFSNHSHFSTLFRKKYNFAPRKARRKLKPD